MCICCMQGLKQHCKEISTFFDLATPESNTIVGNMDTCTHVFVILLKSVQQHKTQQAANSSY